MLITPTVDPVAKIKVVGVGGAGGNTINKLVTEFGISGVDLLAFNTDAQVLKASQAHVTLQLGSELTRGLGAGGDHLLGAQAAEESLDEIHEHLAGSDMVFITAGMGGGTGTGAAPVVAGVAKNLGALTIAVVTKPFNFEGKKRMQVAEEGIEALRDKVDTLIVVPNQRLLDLIDEPISFLDAMKKVDSVLAEGVKSIATLVTQAGFINVDFADVKTIMTNAGTALMGLGRAKGENRAEEAARIATNNPLLDLSIEGATGVLFSITGGADLSMKEINTAAEMIENAVDPNANIIFGASIDESMNDEVSITIIATGFDSSKQVLTNKARMQKQVDTKLTGNVNPAQTTSNDFVDRFTVTDDTPAASTASTSLQDDEDELEVPAFLRRKN
ncbi:MAG TPA: cell division protein FtsZ [Candidatus Dojkabacteria bacterium]|nr:cell division protein FtsZ [Candidatus Dojkabacteria bacterium]HQG57902.1 cell division protein FtsZ [Candidatus Dojkabacteria bacterium]